MEYLVKDNWSGVKRKGEKLHLSISPFIYNDGRKPRLPRKNSKKYKLKKDLEFYFKNVFNEIQQKINSKKFKVRLIVNCGKDRLGKADLDNYCKAILDGITKTQKVWKDDRLIDEISIKRIYSNKKTSTINLIISPL